MTANELFEKYAYPDDYGNLLMNREGFTEALAEALEGGHLQPMVSPSESKVPSSDIARQGNGESEYFVVQILFSEIRRDSFGKAKQLKELLERETTEKCRIIKRRDIIVV